MFASLSKRKPLETTGFDLFFLLPISCFGKILHFFLVGLGCFVWFWYGFGFVLVEPVGLLELCLAFCSIKLERSLRSLLDVL